MNPSLEALKTDLLVPVSASSPCGEDCRYDERFERLKAEISKLSGETSGVADWKQIEQLSRELLRISKDLNLAAYMAVAWIHDKKIEGLVAGLELFDGLIRAFWDQLHPAKPKPRGICLTWFQDKAMQYLEECRTQDRELLQRGISASESLKELVFDKFETPPANFRALRDTLETWLKAAPLPKAPEPPPSIVAGTPSAVPTPQAEALPVTQVASTRQADAAEPAQQKTSTQALPTLDGSSLGAIFTHLGMVAEQLFTQDPFNEVGCLLRRMSLWAGVSEPRNEDRVTSFPDPDSFRIDAIKDMRKAAQWSDLFKRVEDMFANQWYWWDLQFYAATAAEGMNRPDLVQIIEERSLELDQRLPGLKELKFTGGTSFAMAETQDWLAQLPAKLSSGGGGEADEAALLMGELRKLGAGAFSEAMRLAQTRIESAKDGRLAFRMRAKVAAFCIEADQSRWAQSLAQALIDEAEHHRLAHWEPRLAAEAWSIQLEVAHRYRDEETYRELEHRAMQQLAALDLNAVARFPSTG